MKTRFFFSAFALSIFLLTGMASITVAQNSSPQARSVGEAYAVPSYEEVSQTVLMLGGLEIGNTDVADEYARLIYCKLYRENYKDDFSWNNIRRDIITRVLNKKELYRTQYEIMGLVELGRYNFETQDFPLTGGSALSNVGSMALLQDEQGLSAKSNSCFSLGEQGHFMRQINLVLTKPLNFDRFKIPMDEAEKLLDRMRLLRIGDRKLYVRFRLRVQSVAEVFSTTETTGDKKSKNTRADLNGVVEAIDLFFDKEATQHVASIPVQ